MITLRFGETAVEELAFSVSPLLEAVHSWHVLADPGHHPLFLPWVRRCRRLPAALRRQLRDDRFVVRDYVPAFFEHGADDHDADFGDQLAAVRAVPAGLLAAELAETLVDTTRYDGRALLDDPTARDAALAELRADRPELAVRLDQVLTDPEPVVDRVLGTLADYWDAAFAAEWDRIEPSLDDAITAAGRRIADQGVIPMLRTLVPRIRVDPVRRTLRLDRPHEHDLTVTPARPVTFTASHYVWPHVRVTCDDPWPVRITFPVLPPAPAGPPPASQAELLAVLRALASAPRLQIATSLAGHRRSTQELAALLGLSPSVVSRHLGQLTQAGLTTVRRDGYYVLYGLDPARLDQLAAAVVELTRPGPEQQNGTGKK